MREQKEMKYILLEIGGKRILVIKWQKFCRIYIINTWKAKFVIGELAGLCEKGCPSQQEVFQRR